MSEKKPSDQESQDKLVDFQQDYGWLSLRRKSGQEAKRRLNQPVYRIGREIGNDLVLPDPIISRYHARILCTTEGCHIEDLGSQNRTRLNDELMPANEPRPLIEGDVIRIADYTLIFHEPEPIAELDEDEFFLTFAEAPMPEAPIVSVSWPLPPRSSYQNNLPSFFAKDYLLDRFLLIFESIIGPLNQLVDHMPLVLDPKTIPDDLLPWFASWLDLTLNENWPEKHRRDLIRSASELYRWRGTRYGISRYLEIYAGVIPEIDDDLKQAHTFRVTLRVPRGQPVDESLVREIIENEKPAHIFYELVIEEYEPEEKPAPPAKPSGKAKVEEPVPSAKLSGKAKEEKPAKKDDKESLAKEKPASKKKPAAKQKPKPAKQPEPEEKDEKPLDEPQDSDQKEESAPEKKKPKESGNKEKESVPPSDKPTD